MSNPNEVADIRRPFHLSDRPLVPDDRPAGEARDDSPLTSDDNLGDLPRTYGQPVVLAIARSPKSLFVYWDIDWSNAFATRAPYNRKVYLRVYDRDSDEINRIAIEPLANNADVTVARAGSSFRIEIGYFDPEQTWHCVGASPTVTTPSNKIGTLAPGDFALVPFHITFQRLTELFRTTRRADEPLTQALARLEETASDPQKRNSLSSAEQEIYRAMKASISERKYLPRTPLDRAGEMRLRKKLERVVGFGATSPRNPFGGSRRSA